MTVHTVRRLAAELLSVGENRVRIKGENISEVKSAMTRADVKALIDKGIVSAAPRKGRKKRKATVRRGRGSKKGKIKGAGKREWMAKIRAQRKLLRRLVELKAVSQEYKRGVYLRVKSGIFRNKRAMLAYLKENKIIPKKFELPKEEYVPKKKLKSEKKKEKEKPEEKKKEEKKGEKK